MISPGVRAYFAKETQQIKDMGFKYEFADYPCPDDGGCDYTDVTLSRTGFGRLSDKFTHEEGWGVRPGGLSRVKHSVGILVSETFRVIKPERHKWYGCDNWGPEYTPFPSDGPRFTPFPSGGEESKSHMTSQEGCDLAWAQLQYLGVTTDEFYELSKILGLPRVMYRVHADPPATSQFPLFNAICKGLRSK